jgi:hypothetical protein
VANERALCVAHLECPLAVEVYQRPAVGSPHFLRSIIVTRMALVNVWNLNIKQT